MGSTTTASTFVDSNRGFEVGRSARFQIGGFDIGGGSTRLYEVTISLVLLILEIAKLLKLS